MILSRAGVYFLCEMRREGRRSDTGEEEISLVGESHTYDSTHTIWWRRERGLVCFWFQHIQEEDMLIPLMETERQQKLSRTVLPKIRRKIPRLSPLSPSLIVSKCAIL